MLRTTIRWGSRWSHAMFGMSLRPHLLPSVAQRSAVLVRMLSDSAPTKDPRESSRPPPPSPPLPSSSPSSVSSTVPPHSNEPESWSSRFIKQVKRIGLEMWNGTKLLYNNTKKANEISRRRKAGLPITRREHVFMRNNRLDLIRCIPVVVMWKLPIIHYVTLPLYIYYARHMLPSTYKFFSEKSDEFKEMKEDLYMAKLLEHDRTPAPHEAQLVRLLPMERPWAESEVLGVLGELKRYCREDQLSRRQLAAVCYALALHPTMFIPAPFLRTRLRRHFNFIIEDDRMLREEGIADLTIAELREACQHRGVSIWGESEEFLRTQLRVWLKLTATHQEVGPALMIYTHGFRVREMVLAEDDNVAAIAAMKAPEVGLPRPTRE